MSLKTHQRGSTNNMRGRKQSMRTIATKLADLTSKRTSGDGRSRPSIAIAKTIYDPTSVISEDADNLRLRPRKIITEVNDKNIDEVLNLPDVSLIPTTFLTEIEQDDVYATILEELQRKRVQSEKPKVTRLPIEDQLGFRSIFNENNDTIDEIIPPAPSITTNDDYDTDIEVESVEEEIYDPIGKERYRELCEQAKIVPCSYFMAHIQKDEIVLRYHQFSTEDIRAITKTLTTNYNVERLFLDGNYLQQQAAKYISQLIVANDFITELSLVDNRLGGGVGTTEICRMLTLTQNLRKINLSGNKFNELDVVELIDAFERNSTLRELDLSHNGFGEECGTMLGTFISTNDSLESLNLSWNNFRGESAIDVINGIRDNTRLRRCNLEMNGFGPDGGKSLADCIKKNTVLEELNINGNRLNTPNAFAIAQALLVNETLQVLKIADNQINSDGVLAVCLCLKANETSRLREIDFSHTVITKEALDVCEDFVKLRNGNFKYLFGKVTPETLQSNSTSECYIKTNEAVLKRLRKNAAKVKPNAD